MSQTQHDFNKAVARRGTDARKYDPALCPDDVIPMWIADSDFLCPQPIIDCISQRAALGHFGYPYNSGSFGEAVAYWMLTRFGWDTDPAWVDFAPGAVLPLIYGIRALSAPGDKVLLQTPCYPPLRDLVENNGRRVIANPMILQQGRYEINFTQLEQGLSDPRCRVMILCNPHNPTGRCLTTQELYRIGELCLKYSVFVLSDEIHCDIVYEGHRHIPFAALGEAFASNSLIAVNPSKTFNTAGLRTAAFICPNPQVKALVLEQRMNNKAFGRPIFGTLALETAYRECAYYADQMIAYLTGNIEIVRDRLSVSPIRLVEPESTYLLWLDCRGLSLSQPQLVRFFKEGAKLLLNNGASFGQEGEGFMRMNVACPRDTVVQAMNQLEHALQQLP